MNTEATQLKSGVEAVPPPQDRGQPWTFNSLLSQATLGAEVPAEVVGVIHVRGRWRLSADDAVALGFADRLDAARGAASLSDTIGSGGRTESDLIEEFADVAVDSEPTRREEG